MSERLGKEVDIKEKLFVVNQNVVNLIQTVGELILLCETDEEDERYDAMHDIKNRLYSVKKRVKRLKIAQEQKEEEEKVVFDEAKGQEVCEW